VKQVIAKVKLNPGSGGYFDPITRIHLTHGSPIGNVYAGMNTTGLHSAVRSRRISVIEGSLGVFNAPFKLVKTSDGKVSLVINDNKKVEAPKQDKPKKETKVKAEKKVEAPVVEESKAVEEPKEEIVEATPVEEPVQETVAKDVAQKKYLDAPEIGVKDKEIVVEPPVPEEAPGEEVSEPEVEETKKPSRRKKKK